VIPTAIVVALDVAPTAFITVHSEKFVGATLRARLDLLIRGHGVICSFATIVFVKPGKDVPDLLDNDIGLKIVLPKVGVIFYLFPQRISRLLLGICV
jgi:hypothetical protein